jgi:flagellar hook-associated protein 2
MGIKSWLFQADEHLAGGNHLANPQCNSDSDFSVRSCDGFLAVDEFFPIWPSSGTALWLHEPLVEGAMSVVGLSFGSPTSGDGFNVSTTVSEIVANLQNVETPWKTQLKTLESQDTVISSLGTLLSTLSTDMTSLTEATGVLSEKEGSSSNSTVLELTAASTSAVAGTHTVLVSALAATSSGYLTEITDSSDTLSGSITIQVGSGTAQTITLDSDDDTLSELASAINSAGIGVTAAVLTDSSGSRLSLVSGTSGTDGQMTVVSSITDTSNSDSSLSYTSATTGADGSITVDGVALTISSNTVTDLIPGVTFDLLSSSTTAVQVVITNYNAAVESSVEVLVSDYNALVSAINTQEGDDSSGNTEPLYGSPTLTMLQQDILSGANATNPSGYLTAVSTTTGTTLSGSIVVQTANGFLLSDSVTAGSDSVASSATLTGNEADTLSGSIVIQVGSSGTAHTITLDSSDDTISGLASAITSADITGVTAAVTTTDGVSTLTLTSDDTGSASSLVVTNSVRDTSAQTISVPTTSGDDTVSGLADAINAADIGVTAAVVTSSSKSTLTLTSQTSGSTGALTVTSAVTATSDTSLSAKVTAGSSSVTSSATLTTVNASTDTLSGSIVIKVGSSGTAHTITLDSSDDTLSGLASAINSASIGATATVDTDGTTLTLTSGTAGTAGSLTVTSSVLDTTNTSTAKLSYTSSSDIGSLSGLGVTVNTDGTLSLDETTLDSVLNSDYSSVSGFFQNADSWGTTFAALLTSAGTSSSTGILKLAETANSSTESALNKDISREEILISAEESSLTTELNSANEVMQEIPSEISEINELYSAITGYGSSSS